jgi:type IV pilus assembly protein PilC
MPLFSYKAKDKKGKIFEDITQAGNKREAASLLKSDGLQVLTIKDLDTKIEKFLAGSISVTEKAAFCRFMGTMLRAGLPISEAIDIIKEETENKKLKKILFDISFHIRKGSTLNYVLSKYQSEFDSIFITIVKAGEESGTLDKSFDYLSKQLTSSHELSQKVKGSLMYPIVIVAAMLVNAVILITFVLPKMSKVFLQLNVDLPTATKLLLTFGNFLGDNLALSLGVMFILITTGFLILYIRSTRALVINLLSRLPVISKIMNQIDVARFARTLSTLLRSGVAITSALEVANDVLKQPEMKKLAGQFSSGVSKGRSLSEILEQKKGVFPAVMVQTIKAGEKTGSLEEVLEEMAIFYESEVDYSLKRATALLEPLLMLFIGLGVGAMAVMMITPIYSIIGGLDSGL